MSRRQAELEGISWLSICQNATGQIARPSSVSPMSWPLLLTQADPSSPQYSMVTFCVGCGDRGLLWSPTGQGAVSTLSLAEQATELLSITQSFWG